MPKIKTEKDGIVDMKTLDEMVPNEEFFEPVADAPEDKVEVPAPLVESIRTVYLLKKGPNWHLMTVYIENDKVVKVEESNGNTKQSVLDNAFRFLHNDSQARRG